MKSKFDFTLTGFIISMLVVSLVIIGMSVFLSELVVKYNVEENSSLDSFNKAQELTASIDRVEQDIKPEGQQYGYQDAWGYVSAGYNSLFVAGASIGVFRSLMDSSERVPGLTYFTGLIIGIILIGIILGVIVSAYLKWRI